MEQERECQVTSFQALCTAFRHPALTSDLNMVCNLLESCKSWRAALQQCDAGNTIIDCQKLPNLSSIDQFADMAAWIAEHPGLVTQVHLCIPGSIVGLQWKQYCSTAEQLLALSFRQAAAAAAAPMRAGATGGATAQQLGLRSFSTRYLSRQALLEALPAPSLTRLEVCAQFEATSGSALRGLSRLSSLQELSLTGFGFYRGTLPSSCVASIGQLCCLTKLHVESFEEDSDMQLLPKQLQELNLRVLHRDRPLVLGHLTALKQLRLCVLQNPSLGSSLPAQLTALTVESFNDPCSVENLNIPVVLQLQRLETSFISHDPDELRQLAALPQLQHVSVTYTAEDGVEAAPAWQHLPQLRSITIDGDESELSANDEAALANGIASATGLTSVSLSYLGVADSAAGYPAYYSCLTGLQHLQELHIVAIPPASRANVLQLTALAGLTRLRLDHAPAVNDVVGVALACRLTQLQDLQLTRCALKSATVLPAIAALSRLTALDISDNPADWFEEGDIMLLTELRNLQVLTCTGVFNNDEVTMFWDAVKGVQRQQQ